MGENARVSYVTKKFPSCPHNSQCKKMQGFVIRTCSNRYYLHASTKYVNTGTAVQLIEKNENGISRF